MIAFLSDFMRLLRNPRETLPKVLVGRCQSTLGWFPVFIGEFTMGIQVGFMLQDLLTAAKRAGATIDVVLNTRPDVYEEWEDYETGEIRGAFVGGGRDDRIRVIMPDGRRFLFSNTFNADGGIRVWFSNKNVNDEFRDLLDELKVPYDRS